MSTDVVNSTLVDTVAASDGFESLMQEAEAAVVLTGARAWRADPVDRGIEVRAHVNRRMPVTGPGLCETRISAGAAVQNIRLSFAVRGWRPVTTLLPDVERPGLLAVVRRGAQSPPTPAEQALYRALPLVRATTVAMLGRPAAPALRHLLRRAAEAEGGWLRSLVVRGDREKLAASIPRVGAAGGDGTLVLLGSHHDLPAAQIRAGQAVQRVLLTAAAVGLVTTVVAGPTDLRRAGGPVDDIAGAGLSPQVLIVVGHPAQDR